MTTCTRTGLRGALALATGFTTIAAGLLLAAPAFADENERVDVAVDGGVPEPSGSVGALPAITPDGRFVAFQSRSTNLVHPGVLGLLGNIYVRDRQTGMTELVSIDSDGNRSGNDSDDASISADGRFIAFRDDFRGPSVGSRFIYVRDRQTGETEQIDGDSSQGSWNSRDPEIAADGRYVAFTSDSPFLVPNGDPAEHVFVRDLQTDTTQLVSTNFRFAGSPAISADGRFVAFHASLGLNEVPFDQLADVFVKDLQTGTVERITNQQFVGFGGSAGLPAISADGRVVAFQSAEPVAGAHQDVYAYDRQAGTTVQVSVASDGTQGNASSRSPAISPDGRFVAFESNATNLDGVDGNGVFRDIYLHDLETGETERVSVASDGSAANEQSTGRPAISANADFVGFHSTATNIVSDGAPGLFLRIRIPVPPDTDGDGVADADDNCPDVANSDQADSDGDGVGDVCEPDTDGDGVIDDVDNCVSTPNASQADTDGDGEGDACDPDIDGDGALNEQDNCPLDPNADQLDTDGDGAGDVCDADRDGDGVRDDADLCVPTATGAVVNTDGCSIADLVPCDNPSGWRNHGAYVSMTARTAEEFLDLGLITEAEKDAIVSEAGDSECGSN